MELFESFFELGMAAKIYFVIAVASTSVLLVQIALSLIGLDHSHHDFDVGHDVDHDLSGVEGITFFSVRSLVAFFCFFGWVGFMCVRMGLWAAISVIPALAAGLAALICVAYLLNFFYSMAESGTVDIDHSIGEIGTVYLGIPDGKNEVGAVNVAVGGAIREFKAISEDGSGIDTGAKVHVVGTLDSRTLIVRTATKPSEWMEKGISE